MGGRGWGGGERGGTDQRDDAEACKNLTTDFSNVAAATIFFFFFPGRVVSITKPRVAQRGQKKKRKKEITGGGGR